jgi:hypothetical protein
VSYTSAASAAGGTPLSFFVLSWGDEGVPIGMLVQRMEGLIPTQSGCCHAAKDRFGYNHKFVEC